MHIRIAKETYLTTKHCSSDGIIPVLVVKDRAYKADDILSNGKTGSQIIAKWIRKWNFKSHCGRLYLTEGKETELEKCIEGKQ